MSEEEINEALKIIKEPITVNSIEYKYFNQENYEKLLSVYENAKWFVSNWEQVLQELRDTIDNQRETIDRLNNIINELEKWLIDKQDLTCGCGITVDYLYAYENCLDKLKELKEE